MFFLKFRLLKYFNDYFFFFISFFFFWKNSLDTIDPLAFIGQYEDSDGIFIGAGPAPCSNPLLDTFTFELSSNEEGVTMLCRLSRWSNSYQAFDNDLEDWSSASVAAFFRDPKHKDTTGLELSFLASLSSPFVNITGSQLYSLTDAALQTAPYSLNSTIRRALLQAVALQKRSYTACNTNEGGSVSSNSRLSKTFTLADLDHGLKQLQVKAQDRAGNIGLAARYVWFVGE